jgi:nickel transport protein
VFKISILVLVILILMVASASGHDLWVEKADGKLVLRYGHPDRPEAYKPQWVKDVRAYDLKMKPVPLAVAKENDRTAFFAKREPAMITLVMDSGYWTKTMDGFQNISKRGMTDYIESSHYIEPVKSFFRWSENFKNPVGTKLEIVPMKNPLSLKPGDYLPIKVLYEGKPLAGSAITTHGELTGVRSGKDGRADVMIEDKGLQVFAAKHKVPLKNDPDVDTLVLQASLSFEVR